MPVRRVGLLSSLLALAFRPDPEPPRPPPEPPRPPQPPTAQEPRVYETTSVTFNGVPVAGVAAVEMHDDSCVCRSLECPRAPQQWAEAERKRERKRALRLAKETVRDLHGGDGPDEVSR
jgi:hypothetical protein